MAPRAIKVLIVDDEIFFRTVLREMLEKMGCNVIAEAGDGSEAVAAYRRERPDVTVMDIYMPETNGIDAIKEIVAYDPTAKILLATASDQEYDLEAALAAGAKGKLMKPFAPQEVFNTIKKLLFNS